MEQLVRRVRTPLVASLGIVISVVAAYAAWALLEGNGPAYDNPERSAWLETATTTAAVLLGMSGVIFSVLWAASRSFASEAESARQRVEGPDSSVHIYGSGSRVYIHPREPRSEHSGTAALLEPDAQASMLTQIYSHGLAQAKVSFFVSIVFGMVGSAVLLTGVGLAIGHADSNGSRYAAIVTQTAGAVINLLAGVFFLQSNRTRRDMGAQGVMLRDDGRFDRRLKAASVLSDNISDEPLRNRVRAEMALQLVGGELDTSAADDNEGAPTESAPSDAATSTGT
ncbi:MULTISPECIES: hypothetical protein [unclassified Streptomyces]|uniref:TRADD-N-associated membrane domain-containing protein n=1 Tax=unclassified Streptomyces TaxID=2593676 RepID=UPI0036FAD360